MAVAFNLLDPACEEYHSATHSLEEFPDVM